MARAKRKYEWYPRHQCPVCRAKDNRKRLLKCRSTFTHGKYMHWVNCPDHGMQLANYETKETK